MLNHKRYRSAGPVPGAVCTRRSRQVERPWAAGHSFPPLLWNDWPGAGTWVKVLHSPSDLLAPEPPLLTLGEQMSPSKQQAGPLWVLLSTIFLFGLCLTSSSLSSEQSCSGLAADLDRIQAGSQSICGSSYCQKPFKASPARSSPGWMNACPERSQWRL